MKTVVSLLILIVMSMVASNASAAGGIYASPKPKEKYTAQEKEFLAQIAVKAQEVVKESLDRTQFQYDQIVKSTSNKDLTLSAVKSAYQQYKTYIVMSRNTSVARHRGDTQTRPIYELNNDYSPYQVNVSNAELIRFRQTYTEDREFLKQNQKKCGLQKDSITKHYKKQLGEILALAPVVLQINAKGTVPTDQEVIDAYEELIDSMQQTYEQFEDYDSSQIEGLWGYQGIAQEMVFKNPELEPIYESLRIKIEPQNFLQKAFAYIKGIMPAIGPLACTLVAIATVNPLMGIICGSLNLYLAGKNLYNSYENVEQKRREWLSGVSPFQDIERAKKQLLIDQILMGFNLWAGASILRSTNYRLVVDLQFHKSNILSTLQIKEISSQAKIYAKQVRDGELEGQAKNHVALAAGALQSPDHLSVEQLSQASTGVLLSYLRKGMFTFKGTAEVICQDGPQVAGN
ncbi:hypothetical protein K2X05_10290 [bacterium]|nr:hypothetical protein [bacterium]